MPLRLGYRGRGAAGARLLLLAAALLLLLLPPRPSGLGVAATLCPCPNAPPPLASGDVVHIAVLLWLPDEPQGVFRGELAATKAALEEGYARSIEMPYLLGIDLYVKLMRAQGPMPLSNGASVTLNHVYINMAVPSDPRLSVNWNLTNPATGFPTFMANTGQVGLPGAAAYPGGLWDKVVSQNVTRLNATFGVTKPFTFIVTPALLLAAAGNSVLVNKVEDPHSAIVVNPFLPDVEDFVCDGLDPSVSRTPDCLAPPYNRSRKQGARRYHTQFGVLFSSESNQLSALDIYHTVDVRTTVIITVGSGVVTFSDYAARASAEAADQLNIKVLRRIDLVLGAGCWTLETCPSGLCRDAANCPPLTVKNLFQSFVWPDGKTARDIAIELQTLNPDAIQIILGNNAGSWSIAQLFAEMEDIDWIPKTISWGGSDASVDEFLIKPSHKHYHLGTRPWDYRLKGPMYKNVRTASNFELLPARTGMDGPAVFQEAFDKAYGPGSQPGGGAHPMYEPPSFTVGHVLAWSALTIVQKLVEVSLSTDVPTILTASRSVSSPSAFHQTQFDLYGRTQRVNEMLVQFMPDNSFSLLVPYNVGVKPVFPLPSWKERVFDPQFYSEPNERIMLAFNSLFLGGCVALLAWLMRYMRTAVVRAATPSFSAVIVVGGMLMLLSNFCATLVVNDAHCAAQVWLLTMGFTTLFSSLFIKTFRVFRIFRSTRIHVLKMKDSELLLALAAFLAVDVIINVSWAATVGMKARLIVPDVYRPSHNYYECDYPSGALAAVYAHIAIKGTMLLLGIVLTFMVRVVPSQFNESMWISLALYNLGFVLCFILPILSAQLGGRKTVFMLRAFAIMLVVVATLGLLYIPKIVMVANSASPAAQIGVSPNAGQVGANNTDGLGSIADSETTDSLAPGPPRLRWTGPTVRVEQRQQPLASQGPLSEAGGGDVELQVHTPAPRVPAQWPASPTDLPTAAARTLSPPVAPSTSATNRPNYSDVARAMPRVPGMANASELSPPVQDRRVEDGAHAYAPAPGREHGLSAEYAEPAPHPPVVGDDFLVVEHYRVYAATQGT